MYLLLLVFPLVGTVLAGFGGRWLGGAGAARVATTGIALTFLVACFAFSEVALAHSPTLLRLTPWRTREGVTISWGFLFDPLTAVRLIVVTGVSSLVHLYSTSYRSEDPHLPRFRASLSFFTFFRLILVTADNFVQRFVGWEGVGLCSYLLINFWFARLQANKAAIKARVLNRVGDRGLARALFGIYWTFGSLDYAVVFALAPARAESTVSFPFPVLGSVSVPLLDLLALGLLVGAVGKSAQIGLHTWLPDAREGPTPVSALLHAATRVTAGVFLLCRCSPLLEFAPHTASLVTIRGAMTAILAATTGLLQNDLKRVIAYSTCSQLGYRVLAAGLSGYPVARFHLANHAFFKALLFLGAGSVIHARADEQDRRKMGGLVRMLPLTYTARRVGSLALRGTPFLTGFYSKDVILELAYGSFTLEGRFAHTLGTLAARGTAFYSIRLIALTFLGTAADPARGSRAVYAHVHEAPLPIAIPLVLLSFASIGVGYTTRDRRIGVGTDFWGNALFTLPENQHLLNAEWLDTSVKRVPLIGAIFGATSAARLFTAPSFLPLRTAAVSSSVGRALYTFFNRKWFFDKVYAEWVAAPILRTAYAGTYQTRDRGLLELLGPRGVATALLSASDSLTSLSLGFLFRTLLLLLLALTVLLARVGGWATVAPRVDLSCVIMILAALAIALMLCFNEYTALVCGEMAEWSMALACYARLGLYRGRGSNPLFSEVLVFSSLSSSWSGRYPFTVPTRVRVP